MTTPATSTAPTVERRYIPTQELRLLREGGKPLRAIGHFAVFNQLSEDLGGFREMLAPGAFADAIANDDVRALWNHDSNHVLGRNRAGTLTLAEEEGAARAEIDLPDTQMGRDAAVSIERGDVTGMSFGFQIRDWQKDQVWARDADGNIIRTVLKASLFDVSPVTYPAYPQTDISMRSLERAQAEGLIPAELRDEPAPTPEPAPDETPTETTADELHDADLIHRNELLGMTI